MTSNQLLKALKESGTGEAKILAIRDWAKQQKVKPSGPASALVASLDLQGCPLSTPGSGVYSLQTIVKAKYLLAAESEPTEEPEEEPEEEEEVPEESPAEG